MVREPDATMQLAPQDIQLVSKHRVLGFKPHSVRINPGKGKEM
jgi:plastocyanin